MKLHIRAGLVGMLALAAAACGGGDSELDKALEDLRSSDLDTLVLPLDEVGSLGRGASVDPDSGERDNEETAENSIDPDDSEDDHDEAGRISGFVVTYIRDDANAAGDVVSISPSVHLYKDADSASKAMKDQIDDFVRLEGEDLDGRVLEEVETFEVEAGDEAQGITFVSEGPRGVTIRGTAAYGRIGRLGFTVGLIALGDDSWEEDVQELAVAQADYIKGVLEGEIDAEPIEIPTAASGPTGDDPFGVAGLALQLSDLPRGFVETEAAYDTVDPAGEFDYTRSYEAVDDFVELDGGSTRLISIENNIIGFESDVEARAFIAAVSALLEGADGTEFLAELLEDEGLTVDDLEVEQREVDLGDETKVVEAMAATDLGDVVLSFIMSRQGRVVSVFIVTGEAEGWDLNDVGPFAELVFSRLEAAGIE